MPLEVTLESSESIIQPELGNLGCALVFFKELRIIDVKLKYMHDSWKKSAHLREKEMDVSQPFPDDKE